MNELDIYNYGLSILVVSGAMGTSAALHKYSDRLVSIIASMMPQGEVSHRIVIESDPSRIYHNSMTLEG